jgi:hypothetical protein
LGTLQVVALQQPCSQPPQGGTWQVPERQVRPDPGEQVLPLQQGWPGPPQAVQLPL